MCDYGDACILVKGIISVANTVDTEAILKNCIPITDWINEVNNTQIDNAKDIDVVMPMYNSIEYSYNYSKTSRNLWQYYRDELPLANGTAVDFPDANNNSALFNFKQKIPGKTGSDNTKDFEMLVPLKYLSGFWRTIEIPLINCKISLILT